MEIVEIPLVADSRISWEAGRRGRSHLTSLQGSAVQSAATERRGYTLLDVVLTMAIIGLLSAISAPRASAFLDSIAVQGASSDAFAVFSSARNAAVNGAAQATVEIDTLRVTMTARLKTDTILKHELGRVHNVKLSTSRPSITFSASGMGYGAGNLTLVIKRGRAVDSLFVSRLGRVRH